MLEDLLRGEEKSARVLIKDSCECTGRILLLNWISYLLHRSEKRSDKVILVCSERPPAFFSNWLSADIRDRLVCLCGNTALTPEARGTNLLNLVASSLSESSGQSAIVIDSLTSFILSDGVPATCSLLHRLSLDEAVSQVVAVLHTDVHDEQSCCLIEHICTSSVTLQEEVKNKSLCSITHFRPSGKVFRTEEYFLVDDSFHIHKTGNCEGEKNTSKSSVEPSADQSIANLDLPFNLSLTDKEKEARSQVHLPFVKYESESPSTTSGRIHYEPDEADDFDEEDPDDDLNI